MRSRSLANRLFVLTAIWAIVSVSLVAWMVDRNYRINAEKNLNGRLTANLYNIMGSITVDKQGAINGRPDLRDPRFQSFRSGYYWSLSHINHPETVLLSPSLAGGRIDVPAAANFDAGFQRRFVSRDGAGNDLIGIEAQAFVGEGDDLFSFKITANRSEVEDEVAAFTRQILVMLGLFAFGFIVFSYLIVRVGLSPLREATSRLSQIREGKADRLEGDFPKEIQPFIDETNTLIDSNNQVIERARTQVGNLAHSMKTPLAVLRNEARNVRPAVKKVINTQVDQMQRQVQAYLDRARIAARAGALTSRTDVLPVLERLIRVMSKLHPHLEITLNNQLNERVVFAGERHDLEEIAGNLLENACKFANKRITITLNSPANESMSISIADDGPGMGKAEAEKALKRGARMDESKPGSGLGLSIVKDIVAEYKGEISLAKSAQGGLDAKISLPARQALKGNR